MTGAGPAAAARRPPANRRRILFLGVGALAAAAGIGGALWRTGTHAADAEATQALWALRLTRPDGGELVLADFRGRPLLINFWATWCPPCVHELPELDRFARAQRDRLNVVGLAIDQRAAVQDFLRKQPLEFPIGIAGFEGTELGRLFGNVAGVLPFTVLLDARGQVAQRKVGETHASELQAWARRL